MNKRAYIFYFSIMVLGFFIAFFCGVNLGEKDSRTNIDKTVNVNPTDNSITATEGYWVKSNNNKIYVYKSDNETIIAETDIDISEFTLKERKILENGIYLETAEQLFKYLEANTS